MATDYRIEYQIQRRREGDEDFTDIGFGSSGGWDDVEAALYAMSSDVQNLMWETGPGMPAPREVEAEIAEAREGSADA